MADNKGDNVEMEYWSIGLFVFMFLGCCGYLWCQELEIRERRRNNNNNTQQRSPAPAPTPPPSPPHIVQLERRLEEALETIRREEEERSTSNNNTQQRSPPPLAPIPPAPTPTPPSDEDVDCAICLEKETGGIVLYSFLPDCKHVFHAKCITHWLNIHESCPICRTPCSPDSLLTSCPVCTTHLSV